MSLLAPGAWPSSATALDVPAHKDFVATIRAMTRSAAALSDLAVDDVEELQMAIDEAATLLLPLVDPDGDRRLVAEFQIEPADLCVTLRARARRGAEVDRSGLAWIMLTALDPEVVVASEGDDVSISIRRSRSGEGS